ncbi:hypothetical protein OAV62_01920, partial [bacterium]|nr:hypothetical protein [bacterium]
FVVTQRIKSKFKSTTTENIDLLDMQTLKDMESIHSCGQAPTHVYNLPVGSNQLVGMVYPPKLGPLHANFQLPDQKDPCTSPFAEIYDDKVVFRCAPNF